MTNSDLGLEVIPQRPRSKSRDGLVFVIAMWFLSRAVIAIGMQLIISIPIAPELLLTVDC